MEQCKKKIQLQNSNYLYVLKPNIDPCHFQRAYLALFETKLNIFVALDVLGT